MRYEIETKSYGAYDVIVCGGGTAGCFAAIASARNGAKTLLIERSFTIGGMLTIGEAGITKFTEHCDNIDTYKKEVLDVLGTEKRRSVQVVGGLPLEYAERMIKEGTAIGTAGTAGTYVFTDKCAAQWTLMNMLDEAGVEVLYDTRVCLVEKKDNIITGVVVCNKDGFVQITAKRVIDATGDADVSVLAGVPWYKGADENDVKSGGAAKLGQLHEAGVMYRVKNVNFNKFFDYLRDNPERFQQHGCGRMTYENARESYENGEMCIFGVVLDIPDGSQYGAQIYNLPEKDEAIILCCLYNRVFIDGTDAKDLSQGQKELQFSAGIVTDIFKNTIPGFENVKVVYVPEIGVRETRHIVGEYKMTGIDAYSGRDFEDSIGCGGHPADIYPVPQELKSMELKHWRFHIPYRIMIPQKIDNLLVAGRCVSAERVATGVLRPTAQCMVMGEAAGTAAALSIKENVTCRNVPIEKLRKILIKNGAII